MSAQEVKVTNMHAANGIGIGLMLWLIAMLLMGRCGGANVHVDTPVVCECRCTP